MNGQGSVATWIAILSMALGLIAVLRAVILVAAGDSGRFRGDPWVSLFVGCCLILLGRWLLST